MTSIVGIDCATDPKSVGLALASFSSSGSVIEHLQMGSSTTLPIDVVTKWIERSTQPTLFAIDAPLGWPVPLARALQNHVAGEMLEAQADDLFRRATDRYVREITGKQPLDVGADRIARTAYAALKLIHDLRQRLGRPIPLAWYPELSCHSVIEVYPAATLIAHGIETTGYKAENGWRERERIAVEMRSRIGIDIEIPGIKKRSDGLDAVICVLAAVDFLSGAALPPEANCPVEKEGWIWFRNPKV